MRLPVGQGSWFRPKAAPGVIAQHRGLPILQSLVRLGLAHELGVKIVAATDTGYSTESTTRLAHELMEYVENIGMTPLEALRSATIVSADLFGLSDRVGRIAEGFEADLIVTEYNPLEDISTIQDVLMVVNNGEVAVQRGDWPEGRPIS